MSYLIWVPTTRNPKLGHLWTSDDTTECRRTGPRTGTDRMAGHCPDCIRAYGADIAAARPDMQWLTRDNAPIRHAFTAEQLDGEHARSACGFGPMRVSRLKSSDAVPRCANCVETLRRQPRRLVSA